MKLHPSIAKLAMGVEMNAHEVKLKKYLCVPRDAFELLPKRYADLDEATEAATDACTENGQTVYVLEMKAVAARADRPVKVRKL